MTTTTTTPAQCDRRQIWRSRWAAVGAAVAVSLGAGGIYVGNATSGSASSSFVAITPVRVLDTRSNLGLTGVFTSPTARDLLVTGSIATADGVQVVVPTGATAVSMNVTVVGPSVAGFLSVRPADASGAPTTSSLNFAAGQVIPNAVTVQLPTIGGDAGKIEITYNASNIVGPTTHVLVDIVGYYQAAPAGPIDGTPCNQGGLAGTIVNGHNGDGETTVKCFRNLVTTLAGIGTTPPASSDGALAEFWFPYAVAVDAAGNVYVADTNNHRIRKITPAGIVTTLAGSTLGHADGTGTAATFSSPRGVAVDAAGNVYVADTGNNEIRKITAAGVVTTLAGLFGVGGSWADGLGGAARFNGPIGVAVDVAGNVYVADADNNRIRKITPGGTVSTLAGQASIGWVDDTGVLAKFTGPTGVAVDAAGTVYVADAGNERIRKITPGGAVTTLAGDGTNGYVDGTGATAQFSQPYGVAVDAAGNVYVADRDNFVIRKITPAGVVTTLVGTNDGYLDGVGIAARFTSPNGVAVDAAGNLYVADTTNNRIRKIN
jgi:sugar lactone lactonase YvrE